MGTVLYIKVHLYKILYLNITFVMFACDLDRSLVILRILEDLTDGRFLGGN